MTLTAFPPAPQRPPEERERKRQWRAMRGIRSYLDLIDRGPEYECPICRYVGRFAPVREKPGLSCPACDSRPRHRLMRLWMERELVLEPDMRVLHFAAEPALTALIKPRVVHYHTADLEPGADLQLDMTALDLPDAALDLVIANHVLEHLDDRAALSELYRVLAPGGLVALTVPLVDGWEHTHEDPALTPEQRQLYYTDSLHLRLYGRDFPDRVAEAGFIVSDFAAVEPDVCRFGLNRGERVFIGQKPG